MSRWAEVRLSSVEVLGHLVGDRACVNRPPPCYPSVRLRFVGLRWREFPHRAHNCPSGFLARRAEEIRKAFVRPRCQTDVGPLDVTIVGLASDTDWAPLPRT